MTNQGEQIRELQANEINLVSGGADSLQSVSQEFSMLMNAFSEVVKSIGDGLSQMARKA